MSFLIRLMMSPDTREPIVYNAFLVMVSLSPMPFGIVFL